ncbi:hypothetical protein MBLNU230_g1010t1 [Neophaeotheca triangularis]
MWPADPNRAPETHGAEPEALLKSRGKLTTKQEYIVFWLLTIPCWALEIAAAVLGGFDHTTSPPFIGTVTAFLVLHWAAFLQTVWMMVRAPRWRGTLDERTEYLFLARRLQRLMVMTAFIALPTFIVAYVERDMKNDLPYWLLFMLFFIIDTVMSVMNAYNNITWSADRLTVDLGHNPFRFGTMGAILGF